MTPDKPMLDELLTRLRTEVPDCLAAVAIDLDRGTLLASQGADEPPGANLVASVMRDLMARMRAVVNGDGATPRELLVLSADRTYVTHELDRQPGTAVAAICSKVSNLGLLLAIVRREIAETGGAA